MYILGLLERQVTWLTGRFRRVSLEESTARAIIVCGWLLIGTGLILASALLLWWSTLTNATVGMSVLLTLLVTIEVRGRLKPKRSLKQTERARQAVNGKTESTRRIAPNGPPTLLMPIQAPLQRTSSNDPDEDPTDLLSDAALQSWEDRKVELHAHLNALPRDTTSIEPTKFSRKHIGRSRPEMLGEPVLAEWTKTKKTLIYGFFPKYILKKQELGKDGKLVEVHGKVHETLWAPIVLAIAALAACISLTVASSSSPLALIPLGVLWPAAAIWGYIRHSMWSGYRVVLTHKHLILINEPALGGGVRSFDLTDIRTDFQYSKAPKLSQEGTLRSGIAKRLKVGWAAGDTDAQLDEVVQEIGPFNDAAEKVGFLNKVKYHAGLLQTRENKAHENWAREWYEENNRLHGR